MTVWPKDLDFTERHEMRCLAKLGCLTLLAILGVVAYVTRDRWLPVVWGGRGGDTAVVAPSTGGDWQPLTAEGSQRAREAIQRLNAPSGPVFANVEAGDLTAYIFQELSNALPNSADSVQAAAIGDRLYVRAYLRTSDVGDRGILGPLAALLQERERIQMGGVLEILRPGLGQFQVREFKIRDFNIPQPVIPRIIAEITRGARPPEVAPDALPLQTPAHIGDVRVLNGRVTLYKTMPAR